MSIQPHRQEQDAKRYSAPQNPQHYLPRHSENKKYGPGLEIEIGEHRFRCLDVLGKGSYSEVWRGEVLQGGAGAQEVALKEVRCGSQVELQQAIFEVQVLLALERSAPSNNFPMPRVPRCISYKVDPCNNGWKVRTAMTVVPGESLDVFIRHKPGQNITREIATRRAILLAAKLIRDIAPTLQLLAPIAWHRDVNSHNILIDTVRDDSSDPQEINRNTSFWLIDFGLAVDSQSWVTVHGRWRTEDIGGDSRYWPPSSWIMHLLGPEGFHGRQALCDQYQTRLDIHGLGITALELLCTIAHNSPPSDTQQQELADAWAHIFSCWHKYRVDVWRWWAAVYSVFSAGGDIAPVQAQMVRDRVVDQLMVLLQDIRDSLRRCVPLEEESSGLVLSTIADMLDERCTFELTDVPAMLGDKAPAPAVPSRSLSSLSVRARPRSPSPSRRQVSPPQVVPSSAIARQVSPLPSQGLVNAQPWQSLEKGEGPSRGVVRQVSPSPVSNGPIVIQQLSPSRGRSPSGVRSVDNGHPPLSSATPTPRDSQRNLHHSASRTLVGAVTPGGSSAAAVGGAEPVIRASGSSLSLAHDQTVTRYHSVSGFPASGLINASEQAAVRILPRSISIDPTNRLDNREASVDGRASPQRWVGQSARNGSKERGVSRLSLPDPLPPQTQASVRSSGSTAQVQHMSGASLPTLIPLVSQRQAGGFEVQQSAYTPQTSPSVGMRRILSARSSSLLTRSNAVLPAPPTDEPDHRAYSVERGGASVGSARVISDGLLLVRSPRGDSASVPTPASMTPQAAPGSLGQPRASGGGPMLTGSQANVQQGLSPFLLPPPRELSSRSIRGGMRNSEDGRIPDGHINAVDGNSMAHRLTEAMAGLSAAVAAAQLQGTSIPSSMEPEQSGDGDVGAGPPYPSPDASIAGINVSEGMMSPMRGLGRANEEVRRSLGSAADLKDRVQSLEAGDEHERLRERIKNLEESLQKLGRESLERAKLGMEKLAEKYFPKVQRPLGTMPAAPQSAPGLVLPGGATAGVAQVRPAYPRTMPSAPLTMPAAANSAAAGTMPIASEPALLSGGIASI